MRGNKLEALVMSMMLAEMANSQREDMENESKKLSETPDRILNLMIEQERMRRESMEKYERDFEERYNRAENKCEMQGAARHNCQRTATDVLKVLGDIIAAKSVRDIKNVKRNAVQEVNERKTEEKTSVKKSEEVLSTVVGENIELRNNLRAANKEIENLRGEIDELKSQGSSADILVHDMEVACREMNDAITRSKELENLVKKLEADGIIKDIIIEEKTDKYNEVYRQLQAKEKAHECKCGKGDNCCSNEDKTRRAHVKKDNK
jgi:hypothetical protein